MDTSRQPFAPRLNKSTAAEYSSSDSDSEDDHLAPGVGPDDDDFGDFNPRKRRRLGGNNKEKAALGIFGSDSEDDGPGKKWKSKNLRTKGMSFVSTAKTAESSDEDERPALGNGKMEEDEEEEEDEEDEEMDANVGVGLGFRRAPGTWTDKTAGTPQRDSSPDGAPQPSFKTTFNGAGVLGKGFVPSSANEPVLKESLRGKSPPRNKPQPSSFGKNKAKGFGARMMAKMGFVEGKGLGKEGQGRNIIVEANLRPQGVGLGAVREKSQQEREEEKRQAALRGEMVVDSDEEDKKRKRKAKKKTLGSAFDSASSTPRRQKTRYLTADQLKASAPGLNIPDAFTPILDMTGPGGKMLTSASGIMTPTSGAPESEEVIEARKLVKRAQADLLAFSDEWRSLQERKAWVDLELKENEQGVENLRSDFERLQVFSNLVSQELVSATEWSEVIGCLQKAIDLGAASAEVADIAVAAIHPFLREMEWDPQAEPDKFSSDLKALSGLLMKSTSEGRAVGKWDSSSVMQDDIYRTHAKSTTPYESMMYKNWLPRVLAAIRSWDPLEPTPMLAVIESWESLLPAFVRAQLVDSIVRKLETALSDWNPKKKRQSHHLPHTWLFPWLQYLPPYHLDPKGTGLVSEVKRKFRQLIDVWEFERGVIPGLTQWEDILGDQWRPLIMSHVLPSMGKYLRRNFRVDPSDQEPYLPVLTGILKWHKILGTAMLAEVLVQNMFPMWNAKLGEWLALDEADLGEVAEWYSWWRGVLLKDYAQAKGISSELDKGLLMMNKI